MWATRNLYNITSRRALNNHFNIRHIYIDCMKNPGPRCPKYTTADVPKTEDCKFLLRKSDACKPPKNFVSIWQDTDCGQCSRLDQYVRHDDLYLRTTDMKKRTCQQTWLEYPKPKECEVECYAPPATNVIEPEKRFFKKEHFSGDCERSQKTMASIAKCRLPNDPNCTKIKMPGCRSILGSSRCTKGRPATKCKKVCTPYPSYSECDWEKMKELAYAHCKCLVMPVRCEMFENMQNTENIHKLPKNPETKTSST